MSRWTLLDIHGSDPIISPMRLYSTIRSVGLCPVVLQYKVISGTHQIFDQFYWVNNICPNPFLKFRTRHYYCTATF
jgi:hypothetical protein